MCQIKILGVILIMFFDRSEEGGNTRRAALGFVLSALLVGVAGSFFTEPSIRNWYADLTKPEFNPPNWVFAPVWTTLYVMMGIAAWRVWRKTGLQSTPLYLYGAQLLLNFGWTVLFFGLHEIGWALAEIALLFVLIAATMASFWARDRIAGLLFVPYLLWVSFAATLNHALWTLNP